MADPAWLSYTGVTTGVIGAVTGITGSILGYIAYRRTDQLKTLDLRLDLRKSETDLIADGKELVPLLDYAKNSKMAVSAAAGMRNSGAISNWTSEWEADRTSAVMLTEGLPSTNDDYSDLSPTELETKLVQVHTLQSAIARLKKKYEGSVASDDRDREQIKAAMNTR